MSIELVSFQSLWPLVSRVPKLAAFFLRRYFTASRLASLVYVDLYPRNESARADLAQIASFSLYVQVFNLSPFEIELDRADFEFWCAGVKVKTHVLKKETIAAGASTILYLSGDISSAQADLISRHRTQNRSSLSGNIEFNSPVRQFPKSVGPLEGVQVTFLNVRPQIGDA